jgi:hypothetical protein
VPFASRLNMNIARHLAFSVHCLYPETLGKMSLWIS